MKFIDPKNKNLSGGQKEARYEYFTLEKIISPKFGDAGAVISAMNLDKETYDAVILSYLRGQPWNGISIGTMRDARNICIALKRQDFDIKNAKLSETQRNDKWNAESLSFVKNFEDRALELLPDELRASYKQLQQLREFKLGNGKTGGAYQSIFIDNKRLQKMTPEERDKWTQDYISFQWNLIFDEGVRDKAEFERRCRDYVVGDIVKTITSSKNPSQKKAAETYRQLESEEARDLIVARGSNFNGAVSGLGAGEEVWQSEKAKEKAENFRFRNLETLAKASGIGTEKWDASWQQDENGDPIPLGVFTRQDDGKEYRDQYRVVYDDANNAVVEKRSYDTKTKEYGEWRPDEKSNKSIKRQRQQEEATKANIQKKVNGATNWSGKPPYKSMPPWK
jgi:hypothetical protein